MRFCVQAWSGGKGADERTNYRVLEQEGGRRWLKSISRIETDQWNGPSEVCDLYDLKKLPPADVRPVRRGRWIVRETAYGDTEAKCSECGFTTLINEPGNGLHMLSELNYCSGCGSYNGADMRGGDAE